MLQQDLSVLSQSKLGKSQSELRYCRWLFDITHVLCLRPNQFQRLATSQRSTRLDFFYISMCCLVTTEASLKRLEQLSTMLCNSYSGRVVLGHHPVWYSSASCFVWPNGEVLQLADSRVQNFPIELLAHNAARQTLAAFCG
jgi:hypothetical protein